MKRSLPFLYLCVIAFTGILSLPSIAQKITGSVQGDITDPSGAGIGGTKVTVTNTSTGVARDTVANNSGSFDMEQLQPAIYDVTIEHQGFKTKIIKGVNVDVNQTVQLNSSMEVGDLVQEVSVQAGATALQTEESSVSSTIENRQVQELPLNGRQFLQLAQLVPGAVTSPPGSRQSTERGTASSALNINGNREGSNLFLIDGTLNTDPNFNGFVINPNIDSILEFKVQTSTYSAEFGEQAGAQINLITRSGSNQFHGSAYEFLRNSALDAKNLFDKPAPASIPPFRQNQFGATFGGPIVKNKLFVFGSYEGFRLVRAQTSIAVVPGAAERTGDFTNRLTSAGVLTTIYDPATTRLNPTYNPALGVSATNPQYLRDAFAGNMIPANRISPVATAILKYVDLPNAGALPLAEGQYLNNDPQRENNDQYSIRGDYNLSEKNQFFARYSYSNENIFIPGALSTQGTNRTPRPQIATVGYTHIFSPQVINDFRAGFTRLALQILNKNANTTNIPAAVGILGQRGLPPSAWEVPNITFSSEGLTTIGGANFGIPTVTRDNAYQYQDTVSITRGAHDLRMGFQFTRFQLNNATLNFILPSYGYVTTPYTANVTTPTGAGIGSQFADFLLGYSQQNQVTSGSGQVYLRRSILAPWVEDTWRVNRKLTLTLGLRYDFIPGWIDKNNHIGNVYLPALNGPALPIPVQAGVNVPGYGQVPRSTLTTNYDNWGPRIGLAYKVTDATVVRLGYGIFYDAQIGNTTVDMVRNPPFQTRLIITAPDSIFPVLDLAHLSPTGVTVSSSYFAQGQAYGGKIAFPTPRVQEWNVAVERQLQPNWTVTGSYVGSTGRHLSYSGIANIPYPGPGALNPRRPFNPTLTSIFQVALPRTNSYYDALQLKSDMRLFHGVTMLSSYTWSKSIDTAQEIRAGSENGGAYQAINNWDLDGQARGLSAFDQRHHFANSFLLDVPFGKNHRLLQQGVGAALLSNWQVNAIVTASTGLPFTVYSGVDTANSGVASLVLPNVVVGTRAYPVQQTTSQWFNPAAFTLAPDCRNATVFATLSNPLACFGNAGRDILSGPGLIDFDVALLRRFHLGEFGAIQFRGEIFNLFNTPALGAPVATLSSSNVGQITSAGPARQIQFALRYTF